MAFLWDVNRERKGRVLNLCALQHSGIADCQGLARGTRGTNPKNVAPDSWKARGAGNLTGLTTRDSLISLRETNGKNTEFVKLRYAQGTRGMAISLALGIRGMLLAIRPGFARRIHVASNSRGGPRTAHCPIAVWARSSLSPGPSVVAPNLR